MRIQSKTTSPVLEIRNVAKSFGGLHVLKDVSFHLYPGEFLGLIGPNGAGKTTLFNTVTGFMRPDRGQIFFGQKNITGIAPARRVRAGLVRTFQKSMAFPELSVRENLALAVRSQQFQGHDWWSGRQSRERTNGTIDRLLAHANMLDRAGAKLSLLSYGEQRVVDVLISVAMAPRILLLDEPTAGLTNAEGNHLIEVVRTLGTATSVILIAHDIDIVFGTCDRVAVLDLGRLVACDTPDAIKNHKGAQAAYLGATAETT